jgi:hypothetical protein
VAAAELGDLLSSSKCKLDDSIANKYGGRGNSNLAFFSGRWRKNELLLVLPVGVIIDC